MQRAAPLILLTVHLAACGGGGNGAAVPNLPELPLVQSPGGIWFGFDSSGENLSFYIAETGQLRTVMNPLGGPFASFGGGTVSVTSDGAINGSFELRGEAFPPTFQQSEGLGCSLSGNLRTRQSMSVDIACSDSAGIVYDESVTLQYDSRTYERPSDLDKLAGSYTLEFLPDTNRLDILPDGTITGDYHNGARCAVNGVADIVDDAFTLIAVTWTFTSCTDLLGIYENVEMSGFAMANPAPTGSTGAYYFLLTGQTTNGMYAISVLYEPA